MNANINKKFIIQCFIILFGIVISLVKSGPVLHYSTWAVDEQQLVTFALGFLNFNLNPRWFEYHTLPMYLLAMVYFIIYYVYLFLGVVSSKIEFASTLFSNDAVFFISARILCSTAYTFGCLILAKILYKEYRSLFAAACFFAIAIFLPDAVVASNNARVDSFVFLFLALTVYYSCFAEKNSVSTLLALLFCSAAIASKLPAIVFFPIIVLSVLVSVVKNELSQKHIFIAISFVPLCTFLFMPFAVLDFDSYRPALNLVLNRTAGEFIHIGKTHSYDIVGRLQVYWQTISSQTGFIPILCSIFLFGWTIKQKNRKLFFAFLFTGAYTFSFSTSATLDSYWLRPTYPFLVFFSIIFLLEIFSNDSLPNIFSKFRFQAPANRVVSHTTIVALALFFIQQMVFANTGYTNFVYELQNSSEDTRVTAGNWIAQNIPEGSIILLDSAIFHYVPKLFSLDAQTTLDNSDLNGVGGVSKNKFLTEAFLHYYRTQYNDKKKYIVALMDRNVSIRYEIEKMVIPKGAYMVITSYMYGRFYMESTNQLKPKLTVNAQKFYSFIRSQKHIQNFKGRGPEIDIYLMTENLNESN